ncbi:hypothetical protein CEB3_c36110 [Peptococcaceae bacterium CEB3]|nr:hypothetical protein CEB3_c36110 [Peptococcaceae bacterium CEB3]
MVGVRSWATLMDNAELVLLSGSRATGHITKFSDWDYLVFAGKFRTYVDTFCQLESLHPDEEVHVVWASRKKQFELYRSLCFAKVVSGKPGFYEYILTQVYPEGKFPTFCEAQILTAESRLDNIQKLWHKPEAVKLITTNLAHQHAKFLSLELPASKENLVDCISNWDDMELVLGRARIWVDEIRRELS